MENILRGLQIDSYFWFIVPLLFVLFVLVTLIRLRLKRRSGGQQDGNDGQRRP